PRQGGIRCASRRQNPTHEQRNGPGFAVGMELLASATAKYKHAKDGLIFDGVDVFAGESEHQSRKYDIVFSLLSKMSSVGTPTKCAKSIEPSNADAGSGSNACSSKSK